MTESSESNDPLDEDARELLDLKKVIRKGRTYYRLKVRHVIEGELCELFDMEFDEEFMLFLTAISENLEDSSPMEVFAIILKLFRQHYDDDDSTFAFVDLELTEKISLVRAYRELHDSQAHPSEPWKQQYEFNDGNILQPSFEPPDITTIQD